MPRLHEEFDSDRIVQDTVTEYPTTENKFEVACSVCNKPMYIDEKTKEDLERALERDLDYDFTCTDCEADYDRLAFD